MLVSLNEVLAEAEKKGCAIGSFNTPNLENIIAVLTAAEKKNVPVILMHAEIHESVSPLDTIGPVMVLSAQRSRVKVAVHLDHGADLAYLERALKLGFTSVMFDGSLLPYEENVDLTKKTVALAARFGASVEAEIGVLGGREGGAEAGKPEDKYTDPALALRFVKETGIDALACSFGTAHGLYKVAPKLDFERIQKIRDLTGLPLVMHGGSGLPMEDYTLAIKRGIRKINYYTYMSQAGTTATKAYLAEHPDVVFYHDIALNATQKMEENVEKVISVFSGE